MDGLTEIERHNASVTAGAPRGRISDFIPSDARRELNGAEAAKRAEAFNATEDASRAAYHSAVRKIRCARDGHDWRNDPDCPLVDVCAACGEERA